MKKKLWIIYFLVKWADLIHTQEEFNSDIDQLLPPHYDSEVRPLNSLQNSNVTEVLISLYINQLTNVDDADQNLQLDLVIVEEWNDTRINTHWIDNDERLISLSKPSWIRKFWRPDLYIVDSPQANLVNAFENVEKLTITKRGTVYYAFRAEAQIKCSMNLQDYPHDYQYCYIRFSSILYNSSELVYKFKIFDVHLAEYPTFKIRIWYPENECWNRENVITGNSCIVATVKLVRHLSYYIIRYYLLTFLLVVISFLGCWTAVNGWPARITVTVTPLLNLISNDISINNDIKTTHVTSFHWWMMWIQGIVYLTIVEYTLALAWAHFITDKKNMRKKLEQCRAQGLPLPQTPYVIGYYFGNNGWYKWCGHFMDRIIYFFFGQVDLQHDPYVQNKIDYSFRIFFPLIFLLFCLIYILATFAPWAANYN